MLGIRWRYFGYMWYMGEFQLGKDGCLLFFAAAFAGGLEGAHALEAKPFAAELAADAGGA